MNYDSMIIIYEYIYEFKVPINGECDCKDYYYYI